VTLTAPAITGPVGPRDHVAFMAENQAGTRICSAGPSSRPSGVVTKLEARDRVQEAPVPQPVGAEREKHGRVGASWRGTADPLLARAD